jgi:hypothetical protein
MSSSPEPVSMLPYIAKGTLKDLHMGEIPWIIHISEI